MKKVLLYTGLGLLVLLLAVYLGGQFFLGSVVTAAMNKFGPQITQTKFELKGAQISPLTGAGSLTGLAIGNPKGWSDANAIYLGTVKVDMKPASILGSHIVVEEIVIDQPEFLYETKIVSSNINDLLKNIEQALGSKDPKPTTEKGEPIKFEVKHLKITNGKATLGLGATAIPLPLPPIELHDLGTKEGGITPNQLAFAVMRSVTASIVGATTKAAGQIGGTTGAAAAEGLKKTGEAIKGLFGGDKK